MAGFIQANRPMAVTTPLGPETLLLVGLTGREAVSRLFEFQLDLLAENAAEVPFDKLLGQRVTVRLSLPTGQRFFNGVCNRVNEGKRDRTFTTYRLNVVPQFWLLTKRTQSRIFQHKSVPDILKAVLEGLDVSYELDGTFHPRDYAVQYRESDYAFASRLMEEEGIYYFFKHGDGGHKMVVANSPRSHPELPGASKLIFEGAEGGTRDEDRVRAWDKFQELRSGKTTLWDHCFELPHKHLEAEKTIQDSVAVGKVTHKFKVGDNTKLELYDYPGAYAQRFDGVDKGGGDRAGDLQKIFEDNQRTAGIRMQQEATAGLVIRGASNCRQLVSGHKFTLERHFNADGQYLLTAVEHRVTVTGNYVSDEGAAWEYANSFEAIPFAVPYRPQRVTPKPAVQGTQTAVVVGPAGEEIFTDKYSRVKVQFHWDRQGKNNADSSCWCRVATHWAGKQWGLIHIPRIGQEVVVDFLEGDPDQPIIVGSVYNADQMPPYELPANKTQSGIKSRSSPGGAAANFNEIRFEDKKGAELLTIHAEKDQSISVEHDESHTVGHDRSKTVDHDETTHVKHDRTEKVDHDETITIGNDRTESVLGNETITVTKDRTRTVSKNESVTVMLTRSHKVGVNEAITVGAAQEVTVGGLQAISVGAARTVAVGLSQSLSVGKDLSETVGKNRNEKVGKDQSEQVGANRSTKVGKNDTLEVGKKILITAGDEIEIKTGQSSITLNKNGTIVIKGKAITVDAMQKIDEKAMNITSEASTKHVTKGAMVNSEASGVSTIKGSLVKIN